MVVHQDQGHGVQFQCAPDHFARIDGCVVDGSAGLRLIGERAVAVIEKQPPDLFDFSRAMTAFR
jgi:hypothetical protein